MKPPIFICGHRKSGTTVFHNLFDGHPELLVYPSDLNLLYAYFPLFVSDSYSDEERRLRLQKVIFDDLEYQLAQENIVDEIDINRFSKLFFGRLVGADLCNMQIIITALMESYAELMDRPDRTPLIKETSIEIYATEILAWFPEAKFMHLVRDPRDNFAALKSGVAGYYSKMGEDEKQTLASLIYRTRLGLEMGKINAESLSDASYRFVNFNTLVMDIEPVMKGLAEFLGIAYSESLVIPTRLERAISGNNFEGNKFSKISNKNMNRWKERISEEEAQIIEFHLGDLMQEFNYHLAYDRIERAKFAAEFYKWENYKYFYSDRFEK
jgi:hypothetical protein